MLKPSVQIHDVDGLMVAEFWDCLRLDPAPVLDLRNRFEAHLRANGKADLVVDLLGVGFAGSAALGNFVAMQRLARQRGGRLIFCNLDPTVFEVFRVSKLTPLFEFAADRAAAVSLAVAKPAEAAGGPAAPATGETAPAAKPAPLRTQGSPGLLRASRRRKIAGEGDGAEG